MRTKEEIKKFAFSTGVDLIGFTDTDELTTELEVFRKWIGSGFNASMKWIERDGEKRFNPSSLLQDARTVISIGISYYSPTTPLNSLIGRYASGRDYHKVMKEKLAEIFAFMKEADNGLSGKLYVDSSSLAEKPLAAKAGLGFQGKNSILINPEFGSWIFLGELIINREYESDKPFQGSCGNCSACIDACPAHSINENRTINAWKCISYLTIETKNDADVNTYGHAYGCDICQTVCPYNRKPKETRNPDFQKPNKLYRMGIEELLEIKESEFPLLIKDSAMSRIPYGKFMKNLKRAQSNLF